MKKVLSLLLTVLMTLCVFSVNVMAFDEEPNKLEVKVEYVVHANPKLTMPSEKTIFKGETFTPLDVVESAKDDEGTDLKADVKVNGQYDINTVGSYTLTYAVTDKFGGSDTKELILNVINKIEEVEDTKIEQEVKLETKAPVQKAEANFSAKTIIDSVVREDAKKDSELTEKQKDAIKNGADVNVNLVVDKSNATIEEVDKIEKEVKNNNSDTKIGTLLDISLLCTVTQNNIPVGDPSKITKTSEKVKVTVTISDDLVNTDSTVTRGYDVARLHDGIVELLGATYDAANKKLSFDTDRFSTYAIVYTDTKVEQPKKNASSSSSSGYKKPVVNTGWGFNPANIEFFGDSGSTKLEVDGLPECNVLNVSYTETLDLKSADGKTVKANVAFVKEIKTNNDYTLTVSLQNPSDKPAPGTYEGTITVSFATKEYEAKIGDEYYDTLKNAVDSAKDNNIIYLLKDSIVLEQIQISKPLTINLSGHQINISNTFNDDFVFFINRSSLNIIDNQTDPGSIINNSSLYSLIYLLSDADKSSSLHIKNLSLDVQNLQYYYPDSNYNNAYFGSIISENVDEEIFSTHPTIVLENVYAKSDKRIISWDATTTNASLIVSGGTFVSEERGFHFDDYNADTSLCNLKFENVVCDVMSGDFPSVEQSGGVSEFNNCNFNLKYVNNGLTPSWYPTAIGYGYEAISTVNGGSFKGKIGLSLYPTGADVTVNNVEIDAETAVKVYGSNKNKVSININSGNINGNLDVAENASLLIKGGTFNFDPTTYVDSKYHSVNNGDGTYSIEKTALAYIDNFKFSEIDGETTKELFSDSFDSDSNYEKYCPHHTGTNPDSTEHDGFVDSFAIEDGVAKIYSNSAWTNFYKGDMNSATADNIDVNKIYKLQYDVKIVPNYSKTTTDVKNTLTFNYGSWGGSWGSDCLSFAKDSSGNLGIYDSTPSEIDNMITEIEADKFYTIETSFVPTLDGNGQATKITVTTSIIIDTQTKQINEFEFSDLGDKFNGYCWDIYYPAN